MKKLLMVGILAIVVAAFLAPQVLAADEDSKFKFSGEVRTRFDYIENYSDFSDDANFSNDSFSFWPYRVRLGVEGELTTNVKVFAEIQNAGNFGLGDIWVGEDVGYGTLPYGLFRGMGPGDSFGPFMPYYPVFTSALDPAYGYTVVNQNDALLYQGYLQLDSVFTKNLSLRVGRQEHTIGTQLLVGDNEFYNGMSFDGARIMWYPEKFQVDGFYYKLNETLSTSGDRNMFGVTGTYALGAKWGDASAYYIRTQNLSDSVSGYWDYYPVAGFFPPNAGLDTYGVRWGRMVKNADDMKDGAFDWNFEAAFQGGSYRPGDETIDFSGSLIEAWFGWNFATGSGRSRVHVGALMASGQPDDEDETEYKAFVPLFGNTFAYNRLGDLDLFTTSDINDINFGYCFSTGSDKHHFMAAAHLLSLSEDIYLFDPEAEGEQPYSAIGTELDLRYTMNLNKMTTFSAGYATLMADEVPDKLLLNYTEGGVTSADAVSRLYAQVRVRF